MTHCEVGRWIGQSWNFFPSFIDVFENHHQPSRSVRDPHLVGIVAAADHFCERHGLDLSADGETQELSETDATCEDEFLRVCLPRLDAKERSELTEMLETEYLHLLPVIEFNNATDQILDEKKA
jgi:HD-like signal output (HDOD) protein